MSMNKQGKENAISVQNVTKVYRLYDKPIDRLKESMSISHKNYHRDFYALKRTVLPGKKGRDCRNHRYKRFRQVHHFKDHYRRAYTNHR